MRPYGVKINLTKAERQLKLDEWPPLRRFNS
jgi:hypothetical protein